MNKKKYILSDVPKQQIGTARFFYSQFFQNKSDILYVVMQLLFIHENLISHIKPTNQILKVKIKLNFSLLLGNKHLYMIWLQTDSINKNKNKVSLNPILILKTWETEGEAKAR